MSVVLYSHKPKKFCFLQGINGLQMRHAGASSKVFSMYVNVTKRNIQRHINHVASVQQHSVLSNYFFVP